MVLLGITGLAIIAHWGHGKAREPLIHCSVTSFLCLDSRNWAVCCLHSTQDQCCQPDHLCNVGKGNHSNLMDSASLSLLWRESGGWVGFESLVGGSWERGGSRAGRSSWSILVCVGPCQLIKVGFHLNESWFLNKQQSGKFTMKRLSHDPEGFLLLFNDVARSL